MWLYRYFRGVVVFHFVYSLCIYLHEVGENGFMIQILPSLLCNIGISTERVHTHWRNKLLMHHKVWEVANTIYSNVSFNPFIISILCVSHRQYCILNRKDRVLCCRYIPCEEPLALHWVTTYYSLSFYRYWGVAHPWFIGPWFYLPSLNPCTTLAGRTLSIWCSCWLSFLYTNTWLPMPVVIINKYKLVVIII